MDRTSWDCGDFTVGRTRKAIYAGIYERKRTDKDEWYITHDAHEPIISREVFDHVQAIMKAASDARRAKMDQSQEVRSTLVNLFAAIHTIYPLQGLRNGGVCFFQPVKNSRNRQAVKFPLEDISYDSNGKRQFSLEENSLRLQMG